MLPSATVSLLFVSFCAAILPVYDDISIWDGMVDDHGFQDFWVEATPVPTSSVPNGGPRPTNTGRPTTNTNRPDLSTLTTRRPDLSTLTTRRPDPTTIESTSAPAPAFGETPISSYTTTYVVSGSTIEAAVSVFATVETSTTAVLATQSGRATTSWVAFSFTRHFERTRPIRTHTRTNGQFAPGSTSVEDVISTVVYPPVLPSPLVRIPRDLCRRYPLVCVNAGIKPRRFLDDDWSAREDI